MQTQLPAAFIAFRMKDNNKIDTFSSREQKLSAIIFCDPADPLSGKKALKYSYVHNTHFQGVNKFLQFAKKFPTAQYVNFYSRKTKNYLGRVYL